MPPTLLTHRGLEAGNQGEFGESTYESFKKQLSQGFSLEFDVNFTRDDIVIWHDPTLTRLTNKKDNHSIHEISTENFLNIPWHHGSLCTLQQLLKLLNNFPSTNHAIHVKHHFQDHYFIDQLLEQLDSPSNYFLFDLKIDAADYIKSKRPDLALGITVAHPYDIERYNAYVGETLYTIHQAQQMKDLFTWAWLDEWDRQDKNNTKKTLYTPQTFETLKQANLKIALVTPELHGTSPHLLGGEAHEDATPKTRLFQRIKEIIALQPDAICTDWPENVQEII